MKRFTTRGCLLLLLFVGIVGCGETPHGIFRDAITCRNELADVMVRVGDEESAEPFMETKVEKIEKKFAKLRERGNKLFSTMTEEDDLEILTDAYLSVIDEAVETDLRLLMQQKRLTEIRYQLFVKEMENRRNENGKLPNCIDDEMWTLFSSRIIIPEHPILKTDIHDFDKYKGFIRDKMHELISSGTVLNDIEMLVADREEIDGPKVIFVDKLRYQYYYQHRNDKKLSNRRPLEWVVRTPARITSSEIAKTYSALMEAWKKNNKKGPEPKIEEIFNNRYEYLTRERNYVQQVNNAFIIVNDPDPKRLIANAYGPIFFDPGMANQAYAKHLIPNEDMVIDSASGWPNLTHLMKAPENLQVKSIWRSNPFVAMPSSDAASFVIFFNPSDFGPKGKFGQPFGFGPPGNFP